MSIEVEVQVDEQGRLQIPAEIQRQLFPGRVVVLKLDDENNTTNDKNGPSRLTPVLDTLATAESGPELVEKDGWLVVRGTLPFDFDWDAFLLEEREQRLDSLTEWAK